MNFRASRRSTYLESFNFSSLTDVVMQLLIFFLLTFSFANTRGMNVTLPKTTVGAPPVNKTQKQKRRTFVRLFGFGGVDGTRTRDPRRDRPVF